MMMYKSVPNVTQRFNRQQSFVTNGRMLLDHVELFISQPAWFVQDVVGNSDLADVMEDAGQV